MHLQINPNPLVRAYSHHGNINAILDIPTLLTMSIDNFKRDEYSTFFKNVNVQIANDNVFVYSEGKCFCNTSICIEKSVAQKEDISSSIVNIRNLQRDAKVIFYYSRKSDPSVYDDMEFSLTIHRYGFTVDEKGVNRRHFEYFLPIYSRIKVTYEEGKVRFLCAKEDNRWEVLDEKHIAKNDLPSYIGIKAINIDNTEYRDWLMQNYIHLSFDPNADMTQIYLDYSLFPCKNMRYEYVYASQFLDVTYLPAGLIPFGSLAEFIMKSISEGIYVAIAQDEYFIPERKSFGKKHLFHHNLFWGFDENVECFSILGYGNSFSTSILSLDDFLKAGASKEANIILYRRDFCDNRFSFDKEAFMDSLKLFLSGINPYSQMKNILAISEMSYGMKVFDALMHSKKGLWISCFDNRAAYLLGEHTMLWNLRLGYLIDNNFLKNDSKAVEYASKLLEVCRKYLFFVQKNMVKAYGISFDSTEDLWVKFDDKEIRERACEYLSQISLLEEKMIQNVLEEMSRNEN